MPPSSVPARRPRRWGPIQGNLRLLHRRGLRNPPLHELGELVAVARNLSTADSDQGKVIDALAQAIDACWGGASDELPSLRDTMRLWFGLPAVDDPGAPDTAALGSAQRHATAWAYWVGPERLADTKPKEAEETFRTSKAKDRYIALAQKLVQLEAEADQPTPVRTPPASDLSESAPIPEPPPPAPSMSARRSRQRRLDRLKAHRIPRPLSIMFAVVVAAGIAVAAWAPWSSAQKPHLPPIGAIVNAQTGAWTMTAPKTPVEFPTGIAEGESVEVCDLSDNPKCRDVRRSTGLYAPLKVHLGDTLDFAFELANGYTEAIPYIRIIASAGHTWLSTPIRLKVPKNVSEALRRTGEWRPLTLSVWVEWPSAAGRLGTGAITTRHPHIESAYLQVISPGSYTLQYLPGTTTLQDKHPYFFHYLPDGIMGPGIALQDLGEPADCYPCDSNYIRWVYFKARVVKEPGISPNRR